MASNKSTLNFKNGMLTGAKSVVDETEVPVAALGALQTAGVAMVAALNRAGTTPTAEGVMPAPVLLRIVRDPDGVWRLVGLRDGVDDGYGRDPTGSQRMDLRVTQSQAPKEEEEEEPGNPSGAAPGGDGPGDGRGAAGEGDPR
jgi:hypothetical protein